MRFMALTNTRPPMISTSQFGLQEWFIYRAVFERALPSIILTALVSNKYLLSGYASTSFLPFITLPTYSIIHVPLLIGSSAKMPRPAFDFFTLYLTFPIFGIGMENAREPSCVGYGYFLARKAPRAI